MIRLLSFLPGDSRLQMQLDGRKNGVTQQRQFSDQDGELSPVHVWPADSHPPRPLPVCVLPECGQSCPADTNYPPQHRLSHLLECPEDSECHREERHDA